MDWIIILSLLLSARLAIAIARSERSRGTIVGGVERTLQRAMYQRYVRPAVTRVLDEAQLCRRLLLAIEVGRHATRWGLEALCSAL